MQAEIIHRKVVFALPPREPVEYKYTEHNGIITYEGDPLSDYDEAEEEPFGAEIDDHDNNSEVQAFVPRKPRTQKVVHSNELFLKNKGSITGLQLRTLLYVIAQCPKQVDVDLPAVKIPISVVRQLFNLKANDSEENVYMRTMLQSLAQLSAVLTNETGVEIYTTWFDYIRSTPEGDAYVFQLKSLLKRFIMNQESKFTIYHLGYIFALNYPSAIRLYDLLKGKTFSGICRISLSDLRNCLGLIEYGPHGEIVKEKYPEYKRLCSKIIKPSIERINDVTDIIVTSSPVKDLHNKKKVAGIEFQIMAKDNPPPPILDIPPSLFGKATLLENDKCAIAPIKFEPPALAERAS